MNTKNTIVPLVFCVYILLSFYVLGAGMVNALAGYPTWRMVGANEFPAFHQVDSARIIPVFVIFFFLSFIPQIALFWFRPAGISKWLIGLALLLNSIVLVSTIIIQIPIQIKLDQTFSLPLIDRLITSDFTFRRIPIFLLAIVNFIMLYKVVSGATAQKPKA